MAIVAAVKVIVMSTNLPSPRWIGFPGAFPTGIYLAALVETIP
jgi:hypothetical protein